MKRALLFAGCLLLCSSLYCEFQPFAIPSEAATKRPPEDPVLASSEDTEVEEPEQSQSLWDGQFSYDEETDTIDLGTITTVIPASKPKPDSVEFSGDDIQESQASDLPQFLRQKGLLVMNTGGTGSMTNVSIKGYAGFCIKVYVDGVLANNPATGEFDWNSIPLDSISSIEVRYTPSSGEFAGACIYITTRGSSKSDGTTLTTEFKSYENSLLDTQIYRSLSQGTLLFPFEAAYKLGLNFQTASNDYELRNLTTNKGNENRLGSVDFQVSRYVGNVSLSSKILASYNRYACNNTTVIDGVGVEEDVSLSSSVGVYWYDTASKLTHDWNLQYNFYSIDYNETHNKLHSPQFRYSLDTDFGLSFILDSKVEWCQEMKAFRTLNWLCPHYLFSFGDCSLELAANCLLGYGNAQGFLWDINPALTFTWKGLSYSAYRSYVLPTFNQLYWTGSGYRGNPDLIPETGFGHTLSYSFEKISLYLGVTQSIYSDKIRWTGKSKEGSFPENQSTGYYLTFSARSEKEIGNFSYSVSVDYTSAGLDHFFGNQIMWVPDWQVNFGLNYKWKDFVFQTDGTYTGKRYTTNENFAYYNPYFLWSASASLSICKGTVLCLKIDNILDDRYLYHDNYSAPSRSISLIVKVNI